MRERQYDENQIGDAVRLKIMWWNRKHSWEEFIGVKKRFQTWKKLVRIRQVVRARLLLVKELGQVSMMKRALGHWFGVMATERILRGFRRKYGIQNVQNRKQQCFDLWKTMVGFKKAVRALSAHKRKERVFRNWKLFRFFQKQDPIAQRFCENNLKRKILKRWRVFIENWTEKQDLLDRVMISQHAFDSWVQTVENTKRKQKRVKLYVFEVLRNQVSMQKSNIKARTFHISCMLLRFFQAWKNQTKNDENEDVTEMVSSQVHPIRCVTSPMSLSKFHDSYGSELEMLQMEKLTQLVTEFERATIFRAFRRWRLRFFIQRISLTS